MIISVLTYSKFHKTHQASAAPHQTLTFVMDSSFSSIASSRAAAASALSFWLRSVRIFCWWSLLK